MPWLLEKMKEIKEEEERARREQTLKSVLVTPSRDFVITRDGNKVHRFLLQFFWLCWLNVTDHNRVFTRYLYRNLIVIGGLCGSSFWDCDLKLRFFFCWSLIFYLIITDGTMRSNQLGVCLLSYEMNRGYFADMKEFKEHGGMRWIGGTSGSSEVNAESLVVLKVSLVCLSFRACSQVQIIPHCFFF